MPKVVPTHDLQAEQQALYLLVAGQSVAIANILVHEDFFDPVNQELFVLARACFEKYGECDLVKISHDAQGSTVLSPIMPEYLLELCAAPFLITNPIPTIEILKNLRVLRERRTTVDKMNKSKPQELPSLLVEEGRRYAELIPKKSVLDIDELVAEITMDEDTYSTGFPGMDMLIDGGLMDGMLFVVAARPSVGKTSLATCLMGNLLSKGTTTHFISLEMSRKQVIMRMLSYMSKSTTEEVKENAKKLLEAIKTEYNVTTGSNDLKAIEAEVLSAPEDVIIIDYMDLITVSTKEGRTFQLDEISRALKNLAIHAKKPLVLLRQLNREIEKSKENREPNLSDLFGAGEKDADVISFLWDPHAKETKQEKEVEGLAFSLDGTSSTRTERDLKWIVRKNRNGATGVVDLSFKPEHFSMVEKTDL